MQKNNRAVFWTVVLVVASSLLVFIIKLDLFRAAQVEEGQQDAIHLVLMQLPAQLQNEDDLAAGEAQILNITRQLYEAGVLRDGHKAKAVGFYQYSPEIAGEASPVSPEVYVGLQLKAEQFAEVRQKNLDGLLLKEIPPAKYLRTSVSRLNLISLYIARYISLPALEEAVQTRSATIPFRLEVYDKKIRFFVPLPDEIPGDTSP